MIFRACCFAVPVLLAAAGPGSYTIRTLVGTSFVGDGGDAANAILSQPEGLAADSSGNLYIADADDSRVRKVLPGGVIQTVAGTGFPGFGGDGGPAPKAQLDHPYGLALGVAGDLYIADLGNARVRRLSPDGTLTTAAGGGPLPPGPGSDGAQAIDMKLQAPRNVALDRAGNLYISDFAANQIYRVTPGGVFSTVAGRAGAAGFLGDNADARLAQLSAPAGLAVDATGNLFVADSGNGRVRRISQGVITTVFTVTGPTGLAFNSAGTLYVAASSYFGTIAGSIGPGVFARDAAADAAGNLFLSGNNYVRRLAPDGTLKIAAGNGASRYYGGDGGPAGTARLHNPSSLVRDDLGNWYVADSDNHRIRKIDANGVMSTLAGTGDPGTSLGNGTALQAQLNTPRGVALDSLRNLYIADTGNNRVCKITAAGFFSVIADKLNGPEAIVFDSNDTLYIADTGNNRVLKLGAGGVLTTVTELLQPSGLAIDSSGALFVSERVRVSKLPPNGPLTTVLDGLQRPKGLAIAPDGGVVIAEAGANRIHLVSPSGVDSVVAGTGVAGFYGDGGPGALAQLNNPAGVAIDAAGNIWIADSANQRIRELTLDAAPVEIAAPLAQIVALNAASLVPGPIAPDEIVTIFGSGFDASQTKLLFDGAPATLFYVSATQINALAPAGLKPGVDSRLSIVVKGIPIAEVSATVAAVAPALFNAALNEDGSPNSIANPAARGSIAILYGTGWAGTDSGVSVTFGGYGAEVLYAGPAPGFPGLRQINARIPSGFLPPGSQPAVLTVGGATTPPGVTLAIR